VQGADLLDVVASRDQVGEQVDGQAPVVGRRYDADAGPFGGGTVGGEDRGHVGLFAGGVDLVPAGVDRRPHHGR
jgi:hypothetical protein